MFTTAAAISTAISPCPADGPPIARHRRSLRPALVGLTVAALLMTGACSSGGDDKAACADLSSTGLATADYGMVFKSHRDLSDELRSALKELEKAPSATDQADKVAGLCARHGVTLRA